jgi:hypothetical protein
VHRNGRHPLATSDGGVRADLPELYAASLAEEPAERPGPHCLSLRQLDKLRLVMVASIWHLASRPRLVASAQSVPKVPIPKHLVPNPKRGRQS